MGKACNKCGKVFPIWKNDGGYRYCRQCWMQQSNTRINPVSDKKRKQNKEYSVLRKDFLKDKTNSYCKAALPGCTGKDKSTLTIHHMKGRGRHTLDKNTWVTLCFNCHRWVEEHPEKAKIMGLSLNRNENYDRTGTTPQSGEEQT
jgi:hypothetical protein